MKDFNENQQEKGTLLIKSMPQSAQNDTYLDNNFCKNTKRSIKNVSFLRKPRVFKVIAASGLALVMGVGTICGVLIAPMNSAQASLGSEESLTPQEKLLSGQGLGLDPENDPVVYTTDYGLEIKYANADVLSNTRLAGYTYFTMGNYNGADIHWVVIGYDPSLRSLVADCSGYSEGGRVDIQGNYDIFSTLDNTHAGVAIRKEWFAISSLAKPNEEIGDGRILCLAAEVLQGVTTNYNTAKYSTSNVKKKYDAIWEELKGQENMDKICPVDLITGDNSVLSEPLTNQYLFPLATGYMSGENFTLGYLADDDGKARKAKVTTRWWLRSVNIGSGVLHGTCMTAISEDATQASYVWCWHSENNNLNLRPSCVVKL